MSAFLRQFFTLGVSAGLSWWLFLGFEGPEPVSVPPAPEPLPVVLTPIALEPSEPEAEEAQQQEQPPVAEPAAMPVAERPEQERAQPEQAEPAPQQLAQAEPPQLEADADAAPESEPEAEPDDASSPPPAELGAPDGEGEVAAAQASSAASENVTVEAAMSSEALLSDATAELSGEVRPGFATVLLAAPEEQLDVARFFGEEVVLIPKSALEGDTETARYFRLALDGTARVESVRGMEVLEKYRQYRDLFDYEYARLPQALRELRRSVLTRADVYLFGALIPAREWAVVVQRRREALAASGRSAEEARRFILRYRSRPEGGFDLQVEDIVFTDGSRLQTENTTTN